MSKHTPGPWSVSSTHGSKGEIVSPSGFVAFTAIPRRSPEERMAGESWLDMRDRTKHARDEIEHEQEANASLIAAAPELLEALCRYVQQDTLQGLINNNLYQTAWAAIAKATGENL